MKMGVKFTTKPNECTHLVARGIVRTEKFLCAMAVAPFVVTAKWAEKSASKKKIQRKYRNNFNHLYLH
jgi:mediator of DNA damage checkpoint protein 1